MIDILMSSVNVVWNSLFTLPLGLGLPAEILSTQGIMVMLLVGYAGAMWMFFEQCPQGLHHHGVGFRNGTAVL